MYAVDPSYFAEPSPEQRKGNWLRAGLVVAPRGLACLHPGVHARVLVLRDGEEQLWLGTVVESTNQDVSLLLWGSRAFLTVPLDTITRAAVVPAHSHREHAKVCRLQRAGLPAQVWGKRRQPSVEVGDEVYERIEEFARARGLSVAEAFAKLIDIGVRRLAALRRYAANTTLRASPTLDASEVLEHVQGSPTLHD